MDKTVRSVVTREVDVWYHQQSETIINKVAGEAATTNAATMAGESHSLAFTQNRKFILEHMSSSLNFYLNGFKSFNQ